MGRFQKRVSNALLEQSYERILFEVTRAFSSVRIGIITALQKETDAVIAVAREIGTAKMPAPRSALDTTAFYYPIEIKNRDTGQITKAIVCQCLEMGNNSSAIAATCILKDYQLVENLFMVGIAGGIPASPAEFDAIKPGSEIGERDHRGLVRARAAPRTAAASTGVPASAAWLPPAESPSEPRPNRQVWARAGRPPARAGSAVDRLFAQPDRLIGHRRIRTLRR
jgi:hypothetical protein